MLPMNFTPYVPCLDYRGNDGLFTMLLIAILVLGCNQPEKPSPTGKTAPSAAKTRPAAQGAALVRPAQDELALPFPTEENDSLLVTAPTAHSTELAAGSNPTPSHSLASRSMTVSSAPGSISSSMSSSSK